MFRFLKQSSSSPSIPRSAQLRLEVLEDRQMLSATPLDASSGLAVNTNASSLLVAQAYQNYLGRGPDAQGLSAWSQAMQQGLPADQMEAGLMSSAEFNVKHPGLPAGGAARALGMLPQSPVIDVADANNEVRQWNGSAWQDLGQGAIAPDGSFWFLGGLAGGPTAAPLYRSANGQMAQQAGSWTNLLGITSDGTVWAANGSNVYSGNGSAWNNQTSPTTQALAQSAGLGGLVTAYARQYLGQTSPPGSRGECTDLAIAALLSAGARTTLDYGVSGPDGDYVWGTLVTDHSVALSGGQEQASDAIAPLPVRAGDVIQFRNTTVVSSGVNPDGSTWTQTTEMDHHTAIIEAVLGGGSYRILEQNWDGGNPDGRVVHETTINLANMTQGRYWIYQPVAG